MTEQQTSEPAQELSPGIDRRYFLKVGSLATLGLFFHHQSVWACDTSMAFLLQQLTEGELMRNPNQVGSLHSRDFRELWSIFYYIGRKWEDGQFCIVNEKGLTHALRTKTIFMPSYLTEYRKAAEILRCLKTELDEQKALEQLFFVPPGVSTFFSSRLGHIRKFVISEFIRYQVSQGAFRKFGYVNYRGYSGGRYADPSHLPYRGLDHV
jgi:hypothetical protein